MGFDLGPPIIMGPPKMVSGTHTMGPISLGILMGVVWVPLTIFGGPMSLGVPENPIDQKSSFFPNSCPNPATQEVRIFW